jgi:hypothetical protein
MSELLAEVEPVRQAGEQELAQWLLLERVRRGADSSRVGIGVSLRSASYLSPERLAVTGDAESVIPSP